MESAGPTEPSYPVQFDVEYPDRDLSRLSTGFRIFAAIPILILISLLVGSGPAHGGWGQEHTRTVAYSAPGIVVLPIVLMLVFRQKYPRWWFDWNLELMRFANRVGVYLALMDDRYPSTDERQSVALDMPYPDAKNELNRWLPIVKWILAIPHYVVLFFLAIAAFFVVIFAWFAILFTGRYPRGLFDFVLGVSRWYNRVVGYAFVLVTDQYPPFRLSP
jgi:Domain of unknown function (DUF4389)